MIKILHDFSLFCMWIVLIFLTHLFFYCLMSVFFYVPTWLYHTMFFIIGGGYLFILFKYPVRIDITINNKQIIHFTTGGKHS